MAAISITTGNIVAGGVTDLNFVGVSMGPTYGGLRYRKEVEWLDVKVDQQRSTVKKFQTYVRFFVATTLSEVTVPTLQKVWGQPASDYTAASSSLDMTGNELGAQALYVKGPGPGTNGVREISIDSAYALGSTETPFAEDQEQRVDCEWECMMVSGKVGAIKDTGSA